MTQNLHAFHFRHMKRIPTNESKSSWNTVQEKRNHVTGFPGDPRQPVGHSCKLRSRRPLTPLWGCSTCCAKVLLGLLQGVLLAVLVQVVYSTTTRTRPPTPHPPETAANVKGGWLLLPAFQLLIIIIIIITRPKPAYYLYTQLEIPVHAYDRPPIFSFQTWR